MQFDGALIYAGMGDDGVDGSYLADELHGERGNDQLHGQGGNDTLYGGAGHDSMYGGDGNDLLVDRIGKNVFFGGNGNDSVRAGAGDDTIGGEAGNDYIIAGKGNNVIWGGVGNDTIVASEGNNTVTGDDGNDIINLIDGNQSVNGGAGNDYIFTTNGHQFITGDGGNDVIYAYNSSGKIHAGEGNDYIDTQGGSVFVTGDAGNDTIIHYTDNDNDTIYAGDGNDTVAIINYMAVGAARDIVDGGNGFDTLYIYPDSDFTSAAFQQQFTAYKALMATRPWESFDFGTIGAKVSGFEKVQAEGTLTFEDAATLSDGQEQPLTSYSGFTFTQTGIYNPAPGSSLGYVANGNNLAFFAEAQGNEVDGYPGDARDPIVMQRVDGSDFSLNSGAFSSANEEFLLVSVKGYNNGELKYDLTLSVDKGVLDNEYLGLQGVDRVEFHASNYFGMDDLSVII
jgi:Ca2+-binding RTX toxin-like protein